MSLIESLAKLYNVDRQVRSLRNRLDSARRYLVVQTGLLDEVAHRLEELNTRRRHLQAQIANLEVEGGVLDAQLEKFREDLNTAATTKQYTAVRSEMETVKQARSKIDDTELLRMEEIEKLDTELEDVAKQLEERRQVCELAKSKLEEREAEVGSRLTELEAERAVAAGAVPAADLAIFEELSDRYDGEAMAPVEEIDRRHREYACGECNLHMPFEQVATLMGSVGGIVRCTACGRILFLQEEIRGALTPK